MPSQYIESTHVDPVFIETQFLPDKIDIPTMCRAGERVAGPKGIEGAFADGGLWRIYPVTHTGRALLLSKGLDIGGKRVATEAVNPFHMRGHDTNQPSTRVTVGPLPFSISDETVIRGLEKEGLKIRGKLTWEKARLNDRTMSGWKTGRRLVSIELPATPPRKRIRVGPTWVEIYYREMREQTAKCWNCKETGHRSAQCPKVIECFDCGKPGHKKGDPYCPKRFDEYDSSDDEDLDIDGRARKSDDDLQGNLGTEDEGRVWETSPLPNHIPQAARTPGAVSAQTPVIPNTARTPGAPSAPTPVIPQTARTPGAPSAPTLAMVAAAAEKVPLPASDIDEVLNSPRGKPTASKAAQDTGVHRRIVKAVRPTYAEVVSQGESSSSEDEEGHEPFQTVVVKKTKRGKGIKKSKVVLKGKILKQSNITSFSGMSNKRSTTETSPDADSKGSQPQKQRF